MSVSVGIVQNERKCRVCNSNDIGDEFYYILTCSNFDNIRKRLLPEIKQNYRNIFIFRNIMNETESQKLYKLVRFINIVQESLKNPPG